MLKGTLAHLVMDARDSFLGTLITYDLVHLQHHNHMVLSIYRKKYASNRINGGFSIKMHIIYCNTPNVKCAMNEFVAHQIKLCEWLMRGCALSNRPLVQYHGIMHYGGVKCSNLIGLYVSHVHALSVRVV